MKQKVLLDLLNREDSLNTIQNYIKQVIAMRGFEKQPIEHVLLLLTEEVGELAKAVRKEKAHMKIDMEKIQNYTPIENEIADVFIVLISLCNTLNIDLYDAMIEKESINVERIWSLTSKREYL